MRRYWHADRIVQRAAPTEAQEVIQSIAEQAKIVAASLEQLKLSLQGQDTDQQARRGVVRL